MLPPESREPYFILDQGLNPQIARVLAELEYPIISVEDALQVLPSEAVGDETIINHIADYHGFRGVWVTKDMSSKRAHVGLAKRRQVSVVWIQQQTLSTLQQHRIVTHIIPRVTQDLLEASGPIHYLVKFHGQPNRERISVSEEWKGRRERRR